MLIKFDEIVSISNFKGGEGVIKTSLFKDNKVKIMKSILDKGCSIGSHRHDASCEIIYVLSGRAKCIIDGEEEIINREECHYCKKGSTHSIENIIDKPLVLFCIVPEL